MTSRKEDEKNEKIIRGLLKLPENRRCINCNSLGPQYVCTNFSIFVCTTCSGIHREFTHRIKSISMAKFTSQEVSALRDGGNKLAKEVYLKDWDSQRQSLPDSSNVERLRSFIKHVYVEKRYSGERSHDKPPRVKMGEKEESYDKRTDMYQGGNRSPPYEDVYEGRYSGGSSPGGRSDERNYRYSYDERRSPGYGQDKRSPARPEIVNDWRREDRFRNDRKLEESRKSDGDVGSQKHFDSSSPPVVRPVREILGENVIPLRVIEPPKSHGGRTVDGSLQTQRTASSSSLGSSNGNQVDAKWENSKSLIDFDSDPEPSARAISQAPQTTMGQSAVQQTSPSSDNNWASFDVVAQVSQPPPDPNPLDVLSELSFSVPAANHTPGLPSGSSAPTVGPMGDLTMLATGGMLPFGPVGQITTSQSSAGAPAAASISDLSTYLFGGAGTTAHASTPILPPAGAGSRPTDAGNWPTSQHNQSSSYADSSTQPATLVTPMGDMGTNNQIFNRSLMHNAQGPLSVSTMQSPQVVLRPVQVNSSGLGSQPSTVEVKSSGNKELPEDLFTAKYPPFPVPVPAWQIGPQHGMGFSMQYSTAMPMPALQQPSKSVNPFDVNSGPASNNAPVFPSMASLHGALPNHPQQPGLLHPSSFSTPQAYPSPMLQTPSNLSSMPTGPYMGTHTSGYLPFPSHQGLGSSGSEGNVVGSNNMDQQLGGFSATSTPNPFPSAGGNPFG